VQEDYDPMSPCWSSVMTSEVKGNITTTMTEFTTAVARRLGDDQTAGQNRIFVCHGESMCHQLCLHALLRAQNSFLDVCGVIPTDYVEGEMMLPLYLPNNKIFVSLVTWQHAKCRAYDPVLFQNEIGENKHVFWLFCFDTHVARKRSDARSQNAGFYQGILRVTQSFDDTSKDVIVSEFAKNTHLRHGCAPDIVRVILLATVDLLVPVQPPAASGQEEAGGGTQ
jgi:hypothetical protein